MAAILMLFGHRTMDVRGDRGDRLKSAGTANSGRNFMVKNLCEKRFFI
jgi:hypothetical protein